MNAFLDTLPFGLNQPEPDPKTCQHCGKLYGRSKYKKGRKAHETRFHFGLRKFCSNDCKFRGRAMTRNTRLLEVRAFAAARLGTSIREMLGQESA